VRIPDVHVAHVGGGDGGGSGGGGCQATDASQSQKSISRPTCSKWISSSPANATTRASSATPVPSCAYPSSLPSRPAFPVSTPSEPSYPAGHVRLHLALKRILAATSLATIQAIYAALYLLSQYVTALIYYRSRGIPNYVLFLLPLSKRLHSIYILRLFNDCWASTAALAAIYSYSVGNELTGTILYRPVPVPLPPPFLPILTYPLPAASPSPSR
jgi:hypothetical protein